MGADAIVEENDAYAHPESTEGEQVALYEEAPKEQVLYTAAEHAHAHKVAKATITELIASGKSKNACSNLAGTAKKDVTDSVAASQKVVAGMPNGDQCKNEGAPLITKADDAESGALKKLNDAKAAQIDFGKFTVSSLKEGQCGSFFNTKAKTTAKDAAKAVTTAKDEAAKLVKKCQCDSKKAIEKAIKDLNEKSKAANQAAWTKAYHMDCVLAGTPASKCSIPALPKVQPVPFGAGVK